MDPLKIPIDPNGNLATETEGSDTWTYTWNAENQLTKVEKNGVEVARFAYDPDGRRVEKVAGGVTTRYTYDNEDVVTEVRGASTFKYVHGPGIDEPLAREDGGNAPTYYHADGLGSIVKWTSGAGGVVHEFRYDAWGNVEMGASEPGYAFTAREWDPEIQLYHYRARSYDARGGRFTSEDPVRFRAGINFYGYVSGNPVNLVDPLGLRQTPRRPCPGASAAKMAHAWVCCIGGRLGVCYDPTTTPPKTSRCVMAHEEEHIRRERERRDGCDRCNAPACDIVNPPNFDYREQRKEHCDMWFADYYCMLSTPNTPRAHWDSLFKMQKACSRYDWLW